MCRDLLVFVSLIALGCGQLPLPFPIVPPASLRSGISTRIGNFSLELLYHASKAQGTNQNLVISPVTVWSVLAMIAEGATDKTFTELSDALRIPKNVTRMHIAFLNVAKWLTVKTSTIELKQMNALFYDARHLLERDYQNKVSNIFMTQFQKVNFTESSKTAKIINDHVKEATNGRIDNLVDESSLENAEMLLTSALYFKGQWKALFNKSSTEKQSFYDSKGNLIGGVNMMYNRYNYPFANLKKLEARVLELPYGVENRLSMLVMLPNFNITLEDMFANFLKSKLSFDKVFQSLREAEDDFGDDEVDCFIPRFKIESSLLLNDLLQTMGIYDMFDSTYARLGRLARTNIYVSKVIHKAEIEVNEEGTTASAVTAAEIANRIGVLRFEANRPFAYMIVEKTTNTIVFGGLYQVPSLY